MKKYIPYIIALVFAVLYLNQCSQTRNESNRADSVREFLSDSVRYYKNKNGQEIALKRVLQGHNNELNVLLSKQIDSTGQLKSIINKQKRVIAAGNISQETKIDTLRIPFEVPVPCDFSRSWSKSDPYYSISGKSDQNGININSIQIPNTLSFNIEGNEIRVLNSNPYIRITGIDSYNFEAKRKAWGISAFAGYGASSSGLSPLVGVGLTYDLISF